MTKAKPYGAIMACLVALQATLIICATILALSNQHVWAGIMIFITLTCRASIKEDDAGTVQESEARP